MSTTLIVYFASIATAVHTFFILHAVVMVIASAVCLCISSESTYGMSKEDIERLPEKRRKFRRAAIWLVVGATLSSVPAVVLPLEADIYKIAGVSDQQKASIDASGRILDSLHTKK